MQKFSPNTQFRKSYAKIAKEKVKVRSNEEKKILKKIAQQQTMMTTPNPDRLSVGRFWEKAEKFNLFWNSRIILKIFIRQLLLREKYWHSWTACPSFLEKAEKVID